jgi:hypothetical protein
MTDRADALDREITSDQRAVSPPPGKKREKRRYHRWNALALAVCTEATLVKAAMDVSDAMFARVVTGNVKDDENLRRFLCGEQQPKPALMRKIRDFLAAKEPSAALRVWLAGLGAQEAAFVRAGHNPDRIPSALPLCGTFEGDGIELQLTGYTDGAVVSFERETRGAETIRGWGYGSVSPEGRLHLTMKNALGFSHEYQCVLDIEELCGTSVQRLTLRRISFAVQLSGNPETDACEEREFFEKVRLTLARRPETDAAS